MIRFFVKTLETEDCLGPTKTNCYVWSPGLSKKSQTLTVSMFDTALSQKIKNEVQNYELPQYILFLENVSWIVRRFFKWFGMFKSINKGPQGSKNPEIMDMLGFGPSHNKIEKL